MLDGFRLSLQARGLSLRTIENYTEQARLYLEWANRREQDYLRADMNLVTYYLGALAEDHARTSVYLTLLSIRYFYDYLLSSGLCAANPARDVHLPRPRARLVEPFTDDELRRMYYACTSFREQAILLLLMAGLRRGEIFGVTRDAVNPEASTLAIVGKGGKRRIIWVNNLTVQTLESAMSFDERLCPFKSIEMVWHIARAIAKRARVRGRVYPHRFRHSMATAFLEAGGSPDELQVILGHSSIQMSLFYAQASAARRALRQSAAINLTGKLLGLDGPDGPDGPGGTDPPPGKLYRIG